MDYSAPLLRDIHGNLLNNIDDMYDKAPGGFTYDLTSTYAIETQGIYRLAEEAFKELDANNITGDNLDRYVFQRRGLFRKDYTYSKGELLAKGNGIVKKGDLFETEIGTQFQATIDVNVIIEALIPIEAVIGGESGNVGANLITFIPITIAGITEVTNPQKTYDGFDRESDDSLRDRYYLEIQKPATSGNVYHYLLWAREVQGIGDARIFPLHNGDNTVEVCIIDENKLPASSELINEVQEHIDPKGIDNSTWGAGYGEAPIGAYCTVSTPSALEVNTIATIKIKPNYSLEAIKEQYKEVKKQYLKEIAFVKDSVSYSILASKVLDIVGVEEWTSFTLNGKTENIRVGERQVAIEGSVVFYEAS